MVMGGRIEFECDVERRWIISLERVVERVCVCGGDVEGIAIFSVGVLEVESGQQRGERDLLCGCCVGVVWEFARG